MKITFGVLVMLVLGTAPAWAVLGEYESSVSLDQQYLRSEDRVQAFQAYKVHQLTTANGTIIREYISPQGLVFGVAWQAPFMPNLQQLLGSYATEVQQAVQSRARWRSGPLIVRTDKLVFVSGGHMRFFRGRAYVPSLLPNNISAEVVQ
jgi:hypothetical protein